MCPLPLVRAPLGMTQPCYLVIPFCLDYSMPRVRSLRPSPLDPVASLALRQGTFSLRV